MLVLTRFVDQEVYCGEGITAVTVRVLSIRGHAVRLGFVADPSVRIARDDAGGYRPGPPASDSASLRPRRRPS